MRQVTQVRHVDAGLVEGGASRLLGVEGLAVDRVERDGSGARVVHTVTAEDSASACPSCGVLSTSTKGRVTTRPRDIPYGATALRLVWHKRRWRCAERLCPRGSFTESLLTIPARARLTARLRAERIRYACTRQHRRATTKIITLPG